MTPSETFFIFGFISTFSVALLATGWRYLPVLISLYQFLAIGSSPSVYQPEP